MSMKKNNLNYGLIVVGMILFAVFLLYPTLNAKTPTLIQDVASNTCAECHEDMAKVFQITPHAANSCIACHDDPDAHLEEGGGPNIFAFTAENLANEKSKKCLSCHSQDNARFFASPHGKSSMDCTSCHVIHTEKIMPALLKTSPAKNCSTCHQDVFAQFQLNERHRLQEGILSCSTCHDPHEPSARERLGGFKHESCLTCHTDKGGPFLYEHGASRIEGCTSCHEVHGSPNRHMLTHQSTADLCFSCHGVAPDWHSRFDSYSTNCTVCHATIHGSNLSKIFLK
jgi:DmsE family decaheme c-type cytochrome